MSDVIVIDLGVLFDISMQNVKPLPPNASPMEVDCHESSVYDFHLWDFMNWLTARLAVAGFTAEFREPGQGHELVTYRVDDARQLEARRLMSSGILDFWQWLDSPAFYEPASQQVDTRTLQEASLKRRSR